MEESILNTIKRLLGLDADYDVFDTDIVVHINSVLMTLDQLGVSIGDDAFYITGADETWDGLFDVNTNLMAVKTYIYLKVRLLFDPPTNSFLVNAIEDQIKELTWRINIQAEK